MVPSALSDLSARASGRVGKNSARGRSPSALFLATRPEASVDKSDNAPYVNCFIVPFCLDQCACANPMCSEFPCELRSQNAGLSVLGTFVGGAAHADDLRTIATTKNTIATQVNIIDNFTSKHSLRLNQAKTEIVKITLQPNQFEKVAINHLNTITTLPAAKCLGVWWSHNLSALRSVQENIIKARKAFFAFGSIQAFQGNLNPLSAISVFESCVLPILLYGCETWLLDSSTIQLLERFQLKLGGEF